MFRINVSTRTQSTVAYLRRLGDSDINRAKVSTLNKLAAQGKTQMIRGITKEYNIKASELRERIQLKRASRKQGQTFEAVIVGNPVGRAKRSFNVIRFAEKRISIAEHKRRVKRGQEGVYVTIKKGGGKKLIPGAFIGNRGRAVFRRTGKGRLPIEPVATIGIPQMFNTKRIHVPVRQKIAADFPRVFAAEIKFRVSKR